MCLTRRISTGLSALVVVLVFYGFIKTAFVTTRVLLMQTTVHLAKRGNQQFQQPSVNRESASEIFGTKGSGILGGENPAPLSSNETNILPGLSTSCIENHLGLTEYASELCSESSEVCSLLSCRSLLSGNSASQIVAQSLMSKQPHSTESDESFINASLDCESFKHLRAYHVTPLTDEQTSFPLAFSLLVHKSAEQVERLLRALYRPQNVYCIHVDAKSPQTFISAIRAISDCFENVFVASKLETVTWAGFSRLQADVNCMQDLVKHDIRWRYLLNAAGQAFPLKTVAEMVKVLQLYNGTNDIEGISGKRVLRKRFKWEWVETNGRLRLTGRRNPKPPHDIEVVSGNAHGIFSREFVEFILSDPRAADLLTWSKKTLSPDEHYWATLHHTYRNPHLHTPGAYSGPPNEKPWLALFAQWQSDECRGKMVRGGICVFGIGDLPNLIQRREFFANKFSAEFEPLALQCLSAWIRQKEVCPPVFDFNYYSSLCFLSRRRCGVLVDTETQQQPKRQLLPNNTLTPDHNSKKTPLEGSSL